MSINYPMEIVIMTHNRKLYLEKMMNSLVENTEYPYKIIVVDNASNEDTKDYLRYLLRENIVARVFFNKGNIFHYGWQIGIDATKGDMIVLSDPDILVPKVEPCWLTQMVTLMEKYHNIGKLGARLSLSNHPSKAWRKNPSLGPSCMKPLPGPLLSTDGEVYRQYVDTTLHIMRKSVYHEGKMQGELGGCNAGLPRRYIPETIEAVARDIVVCHLGWNDVNDYPDYFCKKIDNPQVFRSKYEYWNILKSHSFLRYALERIRRSIKYHIKNYFGRFKDSKTNRG